MNQDYLCKGERAHRLSTAFDPPTLYGEDPSDRPDIFGRIGESGVSICTLDDMKKLYAGFDLIDPRTSVSMTINGPAPMMLAFYFNMAMDQRAEKFRKQHNRDPKGDEYEQLKKDQEWLRCLEAAGVDNWSGYDYAHEMLEESQ